MTRADSDSPGSTDNTSLDTTGRVFENEALFDGDTEILQVTF